MGYQAQSNDLNPHEGTYQAVDSVTWTKGKHTFKFGGDWRYLSSLNTQVFNNYRMGDYQFNGSVTSRVARRRRRHSDCCVSAWLSGPDYHRYRHQPKHGRLFAVPMRLFAQDDFKVSQSLTINYGLRWEYHPGIQRPKQQRSEFRSVLQQHD